MEDAEMMGLIAYVVIPRVMARVDAPRGDVERQVLEAIDRDLKWTGIPALTSEELQRMQDVEEAAVLALREDGHDLREPTFAGQQGAMFRAGEEAPYAGMPPAVDSALERLCEVMHDAYEAAAGRVGWETQERSRVPWRDVPERNRETMRLTILALLQNPRPLIEAMAEAEVLKVTQRTYPMMGGEQTRIVMDFTYQTVRDVTRREATER